VTYAPATLYLSGSALEAIEEAQHELDSHITSGPDGRCLGCCHDEPCERRLIALRTLVRYGQLPKRRPGLARVRPLGNREQTGGVVAGPRVN
jgi:hypothetical protein